MTYEERRDCALRTYELIQAAHLELFKNPHGPTPVLHVSADEFHPMSLFGCFPVIFEDRLAPGEFYFDSDPVSRTT